jgi:MSHA pilin protein MshA
LENLMKKPAFTAIRSSAQAGFTLIELIVVIVILGILAATALPRFSGLSGDARVGTLNAARGAMQSTVAMIHGQSLINPTAAQFTGEGNNIITVVNGYPAATAAFATGAGLGAADYQVTTSVLGQGAGANLPAIPANSLVVVPQSVQNTPTGLNCYLLYTASAAANVPPTITLFGTADNCR